MPACAQRGYYYCFVGAESPQRTAARRGAGHRETAAADGRRGGPGSRELPPPRVRVNNGSCGLLSALAWEVKILLRAPCVLLLRDQSSLG